MKSLFFVLLLVVGLGFWLIPAGEEHRPTVISAGVMVDPPARGTAGAVGTSGVHEGALETTTAGVVTEIETITGVNDGMTLVGRKVDLHVDVQERATDRAFWVGPSDNRVLVVLARERLNGASHGHGHAVGGHGILPVHGGQRAAIAGVVRPLPSPEERSAWRLSAEDERELLDRKIYIRADTVSSEGHGPR